MRRTMVLAVMVLLTILSATPIAQTAFIPILSALPHYWTWDGGIHWQGRITDPGGNPVSDGLHSFIFTIHDHETASSPVWTEARTESTTDGFLSVRLFDTTPIPTDILGSSGQDTTRVLWLEITVESEVITPRTRLTPVPFSSVSSRLVGDVETSDGGLLVRDPATLDSSISLEASATKNELKVQDVDPGGSEAVVIIGALTTIGSSMTASSEGASGQDGVSIEVGPPGPIPAKSKLFVGGLSFEDRGTLISSDQDTSKLQTFHDPTGIGGRLNVETTDSHGRLIVSNIGSSGLDGVSIDVGGGASVIGIEHEDIGMRLHTQDEGAGAGLTLTDGSGDSSIYAMNKAELTEVLASGYTRSSIRPGKIETIGTGSSLDDRIVLDAGGGDGGRIAVSQLSIGQVFPTEMISLSLVSSEPIMVVRGEDAAPSDPPLYRLEYDDIGRITQTIDPPSGSSGSSELHSSSLRLYDSYDRVLIDGGDGNGGKIALKNLASGETVETEIIAMSLASADPPISIRMPDAGPTDIPLVEYTYDLLDRRILQTYRSESGQPGDSAQQSSTGLRLYDLPNEFRYDLGGIQFFDATGSPFSVSPSGDVHAAGSCQLADFPTSQVQIGGTFPGVKLFVDGNICATGIIGPCSDKRFKQNIETISNPLEKVSELRGVSFDWNIDEHPDKNFTSNHQLGLIAQEVREVLPEVVGESDDGYYFVDYSRLTPVLVEAVKELSAKVDAQNETISEMTRECNRSEELASEVEQLKAQVSKLTGLVQSLLSNEEGDTKLASLEK